MVDLKKFERLSKTEYGIIRNLIVEEGLVDNSRIEQIIERITIDRFELGKSKLEFARTLDKNQPSACKTIISLCYYAMYHFGRSAIFHTHRNDIDVHEKVAYEIGKIFGDEFEKSLDFWRSVRNEVDYSPFPAFEHPLEELALKAISSATSLLSEVKDYLAKRGVKI